mmetsp:Transcript_171019/g.548023  ORF Transcript_171019/g.548023 Transcript_171019/m.548023 type:complete len:312 (+) Transcript_171019:56-991(+)|eukprot:CAMPEP_0203901564 /NCGR_PEP_ID=MMETSP0359-20131031/43718_1 /ASSEMBLY_ACC=CAM_ASM_000338 /TAXON_ID=268821 /ORGANISM="Scrippsiella Hangoei, Strain SHTV-5" /LENGTH=311 /DNA_ID=CAMNT_0050825239 /DNA_START=49 /DNA_END=984 /DNA_ORIENTATION=+
MAREEEKAKWIPPERIEDLYKATDGNSFTGINQPTAGPRSESPLPRGETPFQLYSLATPNGWKVGILLEELGIAYDAHVINIGKGEQFSSGFVGASPNSKIPAAVDFDGPGGEPMALMEGAAIMLYLCEKYPDRGFCPSDVRLRSECLQWLFWQVGSQGSMTGNFGHFMVYAPPGQVDARNYGVARYGMEVQRLLDVLERHLAGIGDFRGSPGRCASGPRTFLVGEAYSVADMACLPWVLMLRGTGYDRPGQPRARDFLGLGRYPNVSAWVDRLASRPAVQRGMRVCAGSPKPWLKDGHPLNPATVGTSKL